MSNALARLLNTETAPQSATPDPAVVADFEGSAQLALRNASLQQPDAEDLRLAREKADAVRLYMDMREHGLPRREAAARIHAAYSDRFPLLQTAGKKGTSALAGSRGLHNLDQWAKQLKDDKGIVRCDNIRALVRDYAKGRRERRGSPVFWKFVGAHYLRRSGPDLIEAYRLSQVDARRAEIPESDWPTLSQVRYWYRHNVDQASIDLARHGEDYYGQHYQYFIDRDWSAVMVNDVWFSDHHELDCPIKTYDEAADAWKPARVFLTAMMDARSLYMVGWQISLVSGSNDTIANSLGLGIINAGMVAPRYLYCDNGADYRATGWDTPVEAGGHEHSVMLQLGVEVINSLPYRAQAKTIERRFREVCTWFAKRWQGYLGNRPGSRSEQAQYFWDNPEHLPTMYELCAEFAAFLSDTYHARPSNGKILGGRTPQQVWDSRRDTRAPWRRDDLYHAFLMPAATRKVERGPMIRYNNTFYYARELAPFQGRDGDAGRILVKRDRYDDQHVYCCHYDGRLICEARTRERISALARTPEEREKIAAAERLKRHQLREAYTAVQAETGGTCRLANPEDRIAMINAPGTLRIETVGSRSSVKGGSHTFTHRRLVAADHDDPEPLPAVTSQPGDQRADAPLQFRDTAADRRDTEQKKLCAEIDDMLANPQDATADAAALDDDILEHMLRSPKET